jgi:hypothetical protein
MPKFGILASYLDFARLGAANGAEIYHLGAAIPVLLNELNLRGFSVQGVSDYGKKRPLTCFSLQLGPSGDGKSTSATTAINHFVNIFDTEDRANRPQHMPKRALEFEGTPEGLRHALIQSHFVHDLQSTIALVYHEELTSLFRGHTTHVAEFLQRLYDGRTIEEQQRQHQRAKTETGIDNSAIRDPKINAIFCSTPDNLAAVISKTMASGGLYGRFLIFVGESRLQEYEGFRYTPENIKRTDELRFKSEVECEEWSKFLVGAAAREGKEIKLSPEAHEVFGAWFNEYQRIIHETGMEDNLRSMLSRAHRTAWTIAGLYATTQMRMYVNAQDAVEACRLVDRCFHMGKVLDKRLGQSEEAKLLDALLDGIRTRKDRGVLKSQLYDMPGIANRGVTQAILNSMLSTLLESDTIVQVTDVPGGRGRPPTRYYAREFAPESSKSLTN